NRAAVATPRPVVPAPVHPVAQPPQPAATSTAGSGTAATSPTSATSPTAAASPTSASSKPSPNVGGSGPMALNLDPGSVTQQQGSSFTLSVAVAHGQDIASVPIQITYDPKVLQFVSVSNGNFLGKDGQPVALVHRDDASAGKLQVTAQRPPGSAGVTGDGTVFSLVFMARNKGRGAVAITIPGARNSHNQPLEVMGSQAMVNVN
ncbi:MAG: cohesin domain-containing protein, partial [Candidatus Angelobacter sp.]